MSQTAILTREPRPAAASSARPRRPESRRPGPPLESGDRMTQREFHRRYLRCPENVWAELVEGTVYMSSPVRIDHGAPHADLMAWLGIYRSKVPDLMVCDNATVILDDDNEVQPDAFVRWNRDEGGGSEVKKGYLVGPPDLVVEVAGSSVSMDMHQKREAYRRNGVKEYLVWRVYDHEIDWWRLDGGQFVPIEADEGGLQRSVVFPGLTLDAAALIAGDLARGLAVQAEAVGSAVGEAPESETPAPR